MICLNRVGKMVIWVNIISRLYPPRSQLKQGKKSLIVILIHYKKTNNIYRSILRIKS